MTRISDIARILHQAPPAGSDPEIGEVTEDSREVESGWLFVAVKGTNMDGHEYVPDAISRGAAAIVSETQVDVPIPVIQVSNSRQALADCAALIHNFPSRRLNVLGITGTDGKTTTTYLLTSILEAAGSRPGLISTVETRVGGVTRSGKNRMTTPSAPFIQRTLAAMVEAGDDTCVLEGSSHALAQDRLRNVVLQAAAITNIKSDHISFHGSRESYAQAKASIFDLMVDAFNARAVLNADDDWSTRLMHRLERPVLTYGLCDGAEVQGRILSSDLQSTRFMLTHERESIEVCLPLPGDFNVHNALAASSLAITRGLDLTEIKCGLECTRKPPGRLQNIDLGQAFSVFVDYAHTVQAFSSLTDFLSRRAHERGGAFIVVFGAAGDRDRDKRPELAQIAARTSDFFVITNEDPFSEDPSRIIAEIATGAPGLTRGSQWTTESDRRAAIAAAFDRARDGDIVAITGKGHEQSIATGKQLTPWNDVDVARELLQERMGCPPT